ncbi:hypothetical protein EDB86DRAFT_2833345 [Lactarius hatsudake]|nr:hypothetical protein EDB86DRAFT_2833345 [Lactarius hatsudake]
MPPTCRTFVDKLTDDEKALMDIAIWLVTALQYRETNLDTVEDIWYRKCISDELDDIDKVFMKYDNLDHKPRIHPVITHIGDEWDSAKDDDRDPDVTVLHLEEVFKLCDEGTMEHPSWNIQLHMKALDTLIGLQDADYRWWLPAKRVEDIIDLSAGQQPNPFHVETNSGSIMEPVSASTPKAPTVDEDVEMEDEDEGETPGKSKKAKKCLAVQSPIQARHVTSTNAIGVSSPEAEAEGPVPTKPLPVRPPPSAPTPVKPAARRRVARDHDTSSGDENPLPSPRKKVKQRASVIDDSASELEDGPTDPGACGPCKIYGRKCKPQKPAKKELALACRWCTKRRVKCDPISAVAQAMLDAKKKNTIRAFCISISLCCTDDPEEEAIERIDNLARLQAAHNTAMYDFMHNMDTMIRAMCSQGQDNVNLSTLCLRKPPVPLFAEDRPAMPSASSVASAPSTVSSMGLGRMTLQASGVSGSSELPSDLVQAGAYHVQYTICGNLCTVLVGTLIRSSCACVTSVRKERQMRAMKRKAENAWGWGAQAPRSLR